MARSSNFLQPLLPRFLSVPNCTSKPENEDPAGHRCNHPDGRRHCGLGFVPKTKGTLGPKAKGTASPKTRGTVGCPNCRTRLNGSISPARGGARYRAPAARDGSKRVSLRNLSSNRKRRGTLRYSFGDDTRRATPCCNRKGNTQTRPHVHGSRCDPFYDPPGQVRFEDPKTRLAMVFFSARRPLNVPRSVGRRCPLSPVSPPHKLNRRAR